MNRIYWDIDKIAMLTDHMDATAHSHGMIQFFLCLEGNLQIKAAGEIRVCPCIAVNQNVRHSFRAGSKRHLTIVFDPMSPIGIRLSRLMEGAPCRIFGEADVQALLPPALAMVQTFDADTYHRFIKALHGVLQADPLRPWMTGFGNCWPFWNTAIATNTPLSAMRTPCVCLPAGFPTCFRSRPVFP